MPRDRYLSCERAAEHTVNLFLYTLLAIAILLALYWLSRRARSDRDDPNPLQGLSAQELLPRHFKYFPQVSQALSAEDAAYLARRAGGDVARQARRARRDIGLEFLAGLREDYRRLDRLARVLTALAPGANPQMETERIGLAIRFEFLWGLVWLRLRTGGAPVVHIRQLAELIGTLTAGLESSMNSLQGASGISGTAPPMA